MVQFEYSYLDLTSFDPEKLSGFHLSFGNIEEEWDDVVVSFMTRGRKHVDSTTKQVSREWINRVCNFIEEQTQIKTISSWINKHAPHTCEHRIAIETESWNKEITLYNFGEFGRHHHPNYAEEEKILLDFFNKIQEFLKEVNINLEFKKVS